MTLRALSSLAILTIIATPALAVDLDADGIPDELEIALGCVVGVDDGLVVVFEHEVYQNEPADAEGNAPDLARVYLAHVAEDRYLWKLEFAYDAQPKGAVVIIYLDADSGPNTGRQDKPEAKGTDVMYSARDGIAGASYHNPGFGGGAGVDARGAHEGNALFFCDDIDLNRDGADVLVRARFLCQLAGGQGDSSDFFEVRIPADATGQKPEIPQSGGPGFKGLTRDQVEPTNAASVQRPRPNVPYDIAGRSPGKPAGVARERVSMSLLEEDGVPRTEEPITFGAPFAEGVVFDPSRIRLLAGDTELPAQVCPTSYWADDSIRWALVDSFVDIDASATKELTVEYGSEVTRAEIGSPLVVTEADGAFTVDTGPMQLAEVVTVDGEVICPSPLAALVLTSADGTEYVATSEVARVELAGPLKTITRTEGPFAAEDGTKLLRHITRATFWAGSSTIELAVTLIDDYLETEFIEISSLELSLGLAGASNATFLVERAPTDVLLNGAPSRLFQRDDEVCTLTSGAGELAAGNHTDGAAAIESADGRGIAVAVEDFWQRYPKALSATEDGLTIELLPDITGETAYGDLPTHLTFPFVGGKYRFKWGMSTTERIALRFRSSEAVPDVTQLGARPLIAVIPSAYYAQTGALGPMAPQVAGEFEAFDDAFANALDRHLEKKEAKREYGFLNWGDWHGERGRNWGNNEYDLAHALFMQFARTGDRRCFRVAQAAARHQADVDCVHAYPDPYYVGANQLHSVCHTGEWSQNLRQPKWSFKYTYHTAATNGHTWSEGMCDAWYLTGDARVMEAAQGLGEHIAWHMAPNFEELGTHERSAGWSLQAIMALYRATRDEAYLDAARRIAIVPLREQKFESTGAWPHVLPGDHAAGVAGAVGNVGFLIGILTSGLGDLHAEAATPELERSLVAAAPFMESLWRPSYRDFQYTSSPGFAEGGSTAGLNGICAQPLGYLYTLTGDEAYLTRVAEAYMGAVRHPSDGFGKSFAQWAREASDLMAVLKSAENPSPVAQRAIALDPTQLLLEDLADVADSSDFRLRGPDGKTFYFLSPGGARTVSASRTLYGAKPKANATGTIRLIAPDGAKLERAEFDTDLPLEWETQLAADSPAGLYTVTIDDDMRAVWDADGEGCKRVLPIETMVQFGAPGTRRYHFSVPGGADSFTVSAVGAHDGEFGLAVYDPEGDMVDWRQGVASGADPGSRTLDLEVRPETSGMWSVVAWARLDLGLRLEGVPAYVSTTADGWFDPTAQ